jgi:hypothetical protein
MNKNSKSTLDYINALHQTITTLKADCDRKNELLKLAYDELFYNDQNTGSEWLIEEIHEELNRNLIIKETSR